MGLMLACEYYEASNKPIHCEGKIYRNGPFGESKNFSGELSREQIDLLINNKYPFDKIIFAGRCGN